MGPAGVFAPTLFSKAYGNLVCDTCTTSAGCNATFTCHNCHYDLVGDATIVTRLDWTLHDMLCT